MGLEVIKRQPVLARCERISGARYRYGSAMRCVVLGLHGGGTASPAVWWVQLYGRRVVRETKPELMKRGKWSRGGAGDCANHICVSSADLNSTTELPRCET